MQSATCKMLLLLAVLVVWGCGGASDRQAEMARRLRALGPEKLSAHGFFVGALADLSPAPGVMPYDLNTPLFSDYAFKARFIKLPEETSARYRTDDVLDFPVGTVLIKNFFYPLDFARPEGARRILETRLLIHREEGWVGLPYVWNEAQTEATLQIISDPIPVSWQHTDGRSRSVQYQVPSRVQCKSCHVKAGQVQPIGLWARQLNRNHPYPTGTANQLVYWAEQGLLEGLPALEDLPRMPVWDDPSTGDLNSRARAWLDVNCAHCHNPEGPANTSALYYHYDETRAFHLGVYKSPIAAGKGSADLMYDIVPGAPEASIMMFRLTSVDPGVLMPELGRSMVDQEGVALMQQWIATMSKDSPPGSD